MNAPHDAPAIDATRTVRDTLAAVPSAARVFVSHGMQCIGCAFAPHETIAEVCAIYRLDLPAFLEELHRSAAEH